MLRRRKKWAIPKGDEGAPMCDVILCERINHGFVVVTTWHMWTGRTMTVVTVLVLDTGTETGQSQSHSLWHLIWHWQAVLVLVLGTMLLDYHHHHHLHLHYHLVSTCIQLVSICICSLVSILRWFNLSAAAAAANILKFLITPSWCDKASLSLIFLQCHRNKVKVVNI